MNKGLKIVLVLLALSSLILILLITCYGAYQYNKNLHDENSSGSVSDGGNVLPQCSQGATGLLQLEGSSNCLQSGIDNGLYYLGNYPPNNYDYVVSFYPTQPFDVCVRFCDGFTGGVCSGPKISGKPAQDSFNDCMKFLDPSNANCIPPTPLAILDGTFYYPYSPTKAICDN